jgi:hypothetical protein
MFKKKIPSYFVIGILQIFILLCLLPACFAPETLVYRLEGEDAYEAMTVEEETGLFVIAGDAFALKPGVYRTYVNASIEQGSHMSVEIKSDAAYFKSMISNAANLSAVDPAVDFELYVRHSVPEAYIACALETGTPGQLGSVEVYRTPIGMRLLVFFLALVFAVLDVALYMRKKILAGKIDAKKQIAFWSLAGAVFLGFFPYLTDYFSIGDNSLLLWRNITCLKDAILNGSILQGAGWPQGLSFPFGGDFFLVIPALLMALGFHLMDAYKLFVLMSLTAVAVLAYHCFYRCLQKEIPALLGALIYLLIPQNATLIYARCALTEFAAMAFYPLIACGVYLAITGEREKKQLLRNALYILIGLVGVLLAKGSLAVAANALVVAAALILLPRYCPKAQLVLGVIAALVLLSAVACGNRIADESWPIYLYEEENLGTEVMAGAHLTQNQPSTGDGQTEGTEPMQLLIGAALTAVTACGAYLFFAAIYAETRQKLARWIGVILYLTLPYRIYVSTQLPESKEGIAYALLPFVAWAVVQLKQCSALWKMLVCIGVGALALAGVGYASMPLFVVVSGLICVMLLIMKNWRAAIIVVAGAALCLPGLCNLVQHLLTNRFEELYAPIGSIMGSGYRFGEYFAIYTWA